jgi:hypothetical protein
MVNREKTLISALSENNAQRDKRGLMQHSFEHIFASIEN